MARAVRFAHFLEASSPRWPGPTTSPWSRGRSRPPKTRTRSEEGRSPRPGDDGGVRHLRRDPGLRNYAAVGSTSRRVRPAHYIATLALDPRCPPTYRRLRAPGLPDQPGASSLRCSRLPRREAAPAPVDGHTVCQSSASAPPTCVMVAHGTPCLGPVTHAGCGAICPPRSGLLWLLRPGGHDQHDVVRPAPPRRAGLRGDIGRVFHTLTPARRFREVGSAVGEAVS